MPGLEIKGLVSFQISDYTNTGFPDESFDVVWAIESVCYTVDKANFIREAYRLLKKGGRLIVADFCRAEQLSAPNLEMVRTWANGWATDDYATRESFSVQCVAAGFNGVDIEDASEPIMTSARRLYFAYYLGIIPAFLYRVFKRNHTALARNNVRTAYLQYKTLRKGLWKYLIVSARK